MVKDERRLRICKQSTPDHIKWLEGNFNKSTVDRSIGVRMVWDEFYFYFRSKLKVHEINISTPKLTFQKLFLNIYYFENIKNK